MRLGVCLILVAAKSPQVFWPQSQNLDTDDAFSAIGSHLKRRLLEGLGAISHTAAKCLTMQSSFLN